MYQLKDIDDPIAAIATPPGEGGIGVVRLSGAGVIDIAGKMFKPRGKVKAVDRLEKFKLHYGWIFGEDGETIDEALVCVMRAPHSYTMQDTVEISCHGSMVALRLIVRRACELGARPAEPGEFTKRAFLNGRLDLAQAEAVLDIINAKTENFLKVSTHQLKGDLSSTLEEIREEMMGAYLQIEAVVNFPEDEIDAAGVKEIRARAGSALEDVERLLAGSEQGRLLKEGIHIAICGRPNVGKSSLLNVLLRQPRAIVSDIAGTTRDTIEESASVKGIPLQLVDTAGILEPRDFIEEEAVKRSRMSMQRADLVLLIVDRSDELNESDRDIIEGVKEQNVLIVLNKSDLPSKCDTGGLKKLLPDAESVEISALKKEGIKKLEEAIVQKVAHKQQSDVHGVFVSNLRHIRALEDCRKKLESISQMLGDNVSLEIVSEEIKAGINILDGITGRNVDEDLLDTIFSKFCIGK